MFLATFVLKWLMRDLHKETRFNYLTWGRGAGAEWTVQRNLASLGADYEVISDFQTKIGKGNIDFIVVCQQGIFTIEVKAHNGFITYYDHQLLKDGRPMEKDTIKQAYAEASHLRELLGEEFAKDYTVTGILEFVNGTVDRNTVHESIDGIWVGGRGFHRDVFEMRHTDLLPPDEVKAVAGFLREYGKL